MRTQKKKLFIITLIVLAILVIPIIAMQFSTEINWASSDFIIAGVLLFCTGFICEYILRKVKKKENQAALCIAIILILVLTWVELAVGVFGTPLAGS